MSASRKAKPSTSRRASAAGSATAPLIAVDVGNTETQVGRFLAGELEESWRVTSGRATTDELRLQLEYTRYYYTMNPEVGDPYVAGGALDEFFGSQITVSYVR